MPTLRSSPTPPRDARVGRFLSGHFALFFMPCCLNDASGQVLYWNHHAEKVTGLPAAGARGREAWRRLVPGREDGPGLLELFLAGRIADIERRYGPEHLWWSGRDALTVLDCRRAEGRNILLCGRWTDGGAGESCSWLAWSRLKDYDFRVAPSVDLFRLLRGLDHKDQAWFGILQDETFCYVSPELIAALYGPDTALADVIGRPAGECMPPAAALDHARTIASLTPENSADALLHWPLIGAEGRKYWAQSSPNILPVNGVNANFSLVRDVTAQKERDSALERLLASSRVDRRSSLSQELLTMFAGRSPLMSQTLETLLRAALSLVTVAVYGETGTGKTLAARLIHQLGPRADGPFVAVNCGAIPEELFESAFFGHVRGAFTGAVSDKEGLLTRADAGTLFLDEIAELSPRAQAKLLQALSEKSYTPVGSTEARTSKFRLIAATNRNLEDCVRRGVFREDLFYRINVLDVHLPPLRERKEDLPLLLDAVLRRNGVTADFSAGEMRLLQAHSWPGNIRELENVVLRYTAERTLDFFHPLAGPDAADDAATVAGTSLRERLARAERDILVSALTETRWNRGRAAEALGVSRVTLFRKMREHGLLA